MPLFLRDELIRRGYHGPGGGLNLAPVEAELKTLLKDAFSSFVPTTSGKTANNRWLFQKAGAGRSVISTERILLLIRLLFKDVAEAIKAMKAMKAMKAANTSAPATVEPTTLESHRDADAKIVEAFRSIGAVSKTASTLGMEFVQVRQALIRNGIEFQQRSSGVKKKKQSIVAALKSGLGTKNVATKFGVSYGSVIDIIASDPQLKGELAKIHLEQRRVGYRHDFSQFLKRRPKAGRADLYKHKSVMYRWLRDHDSEWFSANLPGKRQGGHQAGSPGHANKDWKLEDAIAEKALQDAATNLASALPPQPLSKYAVLRAAGVTSKYERSRHRMPKSCKALSKLTETRLTFRRRRLRWAAEQIVSCGKGLSFRELARTSRLDRSYVAKEGKWLSDLCLEIGAHWSARANDSIVQ